MTHQVKLIPISLALSDWEENNDFPLDGMAPNTSLYPLILQGGKRYCECKLFFPRTQHNVLAWQCYIPWPTLKAMLKQSPTCCTLCLNCNLHSLVQILYNLHKVIFFEVTGSESRCTYQKKNSQSYNTSYSLTIKTTEI